jgi:K+-transporting ATPase KdpF subunit
VTADSIIGALVTVALLIYLAFALFRPEKF